MADEANPEEVEGMAAPPAKKGGNKSAFLTTLMFFNFIIMLGIAYMQFSALKREEKREEVMDVVKKQMEEIKSNIPTDDDGTNKPREREGQLFPLEGFTANLAQGDGPRRFVRMTTVLKFSADSKKNEFAARKAQIRDTIISILNAKRPEDLLKKEGKNFLKEEIKAGINAFLIDGKVDDVYYVSFQIN